MINGLYHELHEKNAQLSRFRAVAEDPATSSVHAHDANFHAERLAKELVDLEFQIHEDIKFVGEQQKFINFLITSKYKSAHRTLALRHVEDAQSRILRELGDKPTI